MKRPTARRTVMMAAGAAVVAAATGVAAAQSSDVRGKVMFEGDAAIPKGQLEVQLEGLAQADVDNASVTTHAESDGKSVTISFSFTLPENTIRSRSIEVVARLERADGWLLARGSAQFEPGEPVLVTLNPAIY